MPSWQPNDLQAIADSDDLHVSPYREDGITYGTPTWIWSVVVDDNLYVRAYNGTRSRWHAAAVQQRAGRIRAAGRQFEVTFELADPQLNDAIDAAYRAKYDGSSYLPPMLTPQVQAATIRILPAGREQ